jgi:hypothetical protein
MAKEAGNANASTALLVNSCDDQLMINSPLNPNLFHVLFRRPAGQDPAKPPAGEKSCLAAGGDGITGR